MSDKYYVNRISTISNHFVFFSSTANILGIAQNVSAAYRQLKLTYKESGPIILNCISGSERSGIVALSVATLTATNSKRPILISTSSGFDVRLDLT